MNKKLILSLLFIMASVFAFAQKENIKNRLARVNNDTTAYVKTYIIAQKNLYVQNPLDSVLSNLPTSVKRYVLITSTRPGYYSGIYLLLNPDARGAGAQAGKKQVEVTISFAGLISREQLNQAGVQKLQGPWNGAAKSLFKKLLVSDIGLVSYP